MKRILGLDLGTNSIGWALVGETDKKKEILGIGSRIIPMSQDILGKFDSGNSISQTAERTEYRGIRRIRERYLLRRERLHRILHLMGFLPDHYEQSIDFENRLGKFINDTEPKLVWKEVEPKRFDFIFKSSFNEMVEEFKISKPELFTLNAKGEERKIPYDWTIYYLRKKALLHKIEKEELAWLLLNFNQKRGYYQLRGEEEEENHNKLVEFHALKVVDVNVDEPQKGKTDLWYNVVLENGWIYRRSSKTPLFDWKEKIKEFIVTTDVNEDGTVKTDKEGNEKRSFRAPSEDDWTLLKKKTESDIYKSNKTVGCYIYDTLLQNPTQKINGKLVRTIERKFYKQELKAILEKQKSYHQELQNNDLYNTCLKELYQNNEAHRKTLQNADYTKLFIEDIIFYQRPLKSKKSLISNCPYEFRVFKNEAGELKKESIKCIAKSHPLFQEFRLWQFISNIKIYQKEKIVNDKLQTDVDVTNDFLKNEDDYIALFEWLNGRKEVDQKAFLKYPRFELKKNAENYRWNYVEDKPYPCNETRALILSRLEKAGNTTSNFLSKKNEEALWHILYSVEDKYEIGKALRSFAGKHNLGDNFVEIFKKFPPFKKEYGSYSAKAIKKLLPLMRMGKYWNENEINEQTKQRIEKIITGEYDETIRNRVREKAINLTDIAHFKSLPLWLTCYIAYDRHSEAGDLKKWNSPQDIENYLRNEFKQHSLRNPIVEQVITETLRVVKDIWKNYGEKNEKGEYHPLFDEIHIELGREMKNPADKRKRMTEQINENENTNLRIKALLVELMNCSDVENVRPYSPSQQEILKIYEEGVLNSSAEVPDDIAKIIKSGQPTKSELIRYKCWLEQGYRSPYTGGTIPLTKLFTSAYEIEHIIPQSRYFDDSLSNKVICESEINKIKDNNLGYEFIKNHHGENIELSYGKTVRIFTIPEYEDFVKRQYGKIRSKMNKLLMEDIPEAFIERQLNDSRYISKVVKSLLSNIVREYGEQEATSKNVISCSGGVTSILKHDWGLNDVWNSIVYPRFERMNEKTNSNGFGHWTNKEGKRVFQTEMPLELQKGFNKKRIDHRHHAMDALVIACASRNHINYLNNEHARQKENKIRFELRNKLRRLEEIVVDRYENGQKVRKNIKVAKEFYKPWETFTQDAHAALESIVVSFKQNLRVINKTVNKIESYKDEDGNLQLDKNGKPTKGQREQVKGDHWAIRKPLHKETISGQVNLRFKKQIMLSAAIDQWEMLVDKSLKTKIKQLINEGFDKKKILKFFDDKEKKWQEKEISRPEVYYFSNEKEILVASRTALNQSFKSKTIESITDTGIQKILKIHLSNFDEEKDGKIVEHPELAFSPEGIDDMNKNIKELNSGKAHQPITKIRTYEAKGNKFNVGTKGNKEDKFVVAATGTNLFFAVYIDESEKRSYETIPLNEVIEHQKWRANLSNEQVKTTSLIPIKLEKGKFLFSLSPNDLVYVPTKEQTTQISVAEIDRSRIYKFIDSSETTANFIPASSASTIFNLNKKDQEKLGMDFGVQNEFGVGSPQSKNQKAFTDEMIKDVCIKLKVDRLGNFSF